MPTPLPITRAGTGISDLGILITFWTWNNVDLNPERRSELEFRRIERKNTGSTIDNSEHSTISSSGTHNIQNDHREANGDLAFMIMNANSHSAALLNSQSLIKPH